MLHPVYKCDDFKMESGQLTIYNAELVAMVSSLSDFNAFTYTLKYDAVICPQWYTDEDGNKVKIVIFK
jgi:hypothetical protein